jgi:hypothetical protein
MLHRRETKTKQRLELPHLFGLESLEGLKNTSSSQLFQSQCFVLHEGRLAPWQEIAKQRMPGSDVIVLCSPRLLLLNILSSDCVTCHIRSLLASGNSGKLFSQGRRAFNR